MAMTALQKVERPAGSDTRRTLLGYDKTALTIVAASTTSGTPGEGVPA